MRRLSCTIYVGNLPGDIRESEIEDLFYKYGRIIYIDLKLPPRPPGYCFIEFEDPRDAEDAVRGRDGYKFDGHRLRVEMARGGRASSPDTYGRYSSSSHSYGLPRRSEYRVIVYGLPSSASWQDLKDHMRRAGDVCFAQVYRKSSGTIGVVDYTTYEDMKYAIRRLDDTEFRNPFSRSYIRVEEDRGSRSYSRSPSYDYYRRSHRRSYSRSYSRSPTYNSRRSYSRSYSRSPSLARSQSSRSLARSRSRSISRSLAPSRTYSRSISRSPEWLARSRSRSTSRAGAKMRSRACSRSFSKSHEQLPSRSLSRSISRSPSPSRSHSISRSFSLSRSISRSPQKRRSSKSSSRFQHGISRKLRSRSCSYTPRSSSISRSRSRSRSLSESSYRKGRDRSYR